MDDLDGPQGPQVTIRKAGSENVDFVLSNVDLSYVVSVYCLLAE